MKKFARIEPTTVHSVGDKYKRQAVIKTFRTEDGKMHEFTTWGKEGGRAGAVIAITPELQVVVVRQFRAGPERMMYDLPGGGINEGEDPQAGVLRELREETGYVPGHIEFLGDSIRDAYVNGTWYYYLGTDCKLSEKGSEQDEEEYDQGAEVQLISIDELIENARQGNMTDPVAVLQAYETLKEMANDQSN
jgi:ADP-ribose pyrophosphatase